MTTSVELARVPSPGQLDERWLFETRERIALLDDVDEVARWELQLNAAQAALTAVNRERSPLAALRNVARRRLGELQVDGTHIGGSPSSLVGEHVLTSSEKTERAQRRLVAEHVTADECAAESSWKKLVTLARERRRETEQKTSSNGHKKKLPRDERIAQIRELTAKGYRSSQIAATLGIGQPRVRELARQGGITLVDVFIDSDLKLDANELVETIVREVETSALMLDMLPKGWVDTLDRMLVPYWRETLRDKLPRLTQLQRSLVVLKEKGDESDEVSHE
jgi:hypothetical protein